jgi:hypothetical protein
MIFFIVFSFIILLSLAFLTVLNCDKCIKKNITRSPRSLADVRKYAHMTWMTCSQVVRDPTRDEYRPVPGHTAVYPVLQHVDTPAKIKVYRVLGVRR